MSPELAESPSNRADAGPELPVQQRRDFATRFKPGNRANPNGRPRTAFFKRHLLRQLRAEIAANTTRADVVCDAVVSKAEKGDLTAATFMRDTVDGLPGKAENQISLGVAVTVQHIGGDDEE